MFPEIMASTIGKVLAGTSFAFSIFILVDNKSPENIIEYRRIANEYKKLYDALFMLFENDSASPEKVERILVEKSLLNEKTSQFPIRQLARIWTNCVIDREMNLSWTKKS